MTYDEAMVEVRRGYSVARIGWPDGAFLKLVFLDERPSFIERTMPGFRANRQTRVDKFAAVGEPETAYDVAREDLEATDWRTVRGGSPIGKPRDKAFLVFEPARVQGFIDRTRAKTVG